MILTSSTFAPDYNALEKFVTMKCLSKIGEEMKILRLFKKKLKGLEIFAKKFSCMVLFGFISFTFVTKKNKQKTKVSNIR